MSGENEPGDAGYGEPKDHGANVRPPSGGKAKGASAEHLAPPVLHLEAHHIEKLFKNKMPPVGSKIKFNAVAHVGAYNEDSSGPPSGGKAQQGGEGSTKRTMALHFHKMQTDVGTEHAPGVDQEAERAKGAKAEMDKALEREAGGKKGKGSRNSEDEEGNIGESDDAPRGNNGPSTKGMRKQK